MVHIPGSSTGLVEVASLSGVKEWHVKRKATIYRPSKNPMQSGTTKFKTWVLHFDKGQRWTNPLMGWTSSRDPVSNLKLQFATPEEAIAYAERQGLMYEVITPKDRGLIGKTYESNFKYRPLRKNPLEGL
jgi:NADH dehydrogenase (ubiquinone) Fe-S protein 4